jgi:hypothetical protein
MELPGAPSHVVLQTLDDKDISIHGREKVANRFQFIVGDSPMDLQWVVQTPNAHYRPTSSSIRGCFQAELRHFRLRLAECITRYTEKVLEQADPTSVRIADDTPEGLALP